MATLTREAVTEAGLTPTGAAAAGGGDQFENTGVEYLYVKNGGGGSINVTITAQDTSVTMANYGTLTKADSVVAVAAGATAIIGLFPKSAYNDANSYVQVTYSGVTSVTVAVLYFTS
jgi:hypothetical protein